MALNRLQAVSFPTFGNNNLITLPKFGAQTPPIQRNLNFNLNPQAADLFAQEQPKTVRIVLTSPDGLKNRLDRSLQSWVTNMQVDDGNPTAGLNVLLDKVSTMLSGLIDKNKVTDDLGNMYATYEFKRGVSNGSENRLKIVDAFKQALDKLPDNVQGVTVDLPEKLPDGVDRGQLLRDLTEESVLHQYNYRMRRQHPWPTSQLKTVEFSKRGIHNADTLVAEGNAIGSAMNFARHFVDSGANLKTTGYMSRKAKELESDTMKVHVRQDQFLEGNDPENAHRMGLFLSVAQGNNPHDTEKKPRLVEMVYTPADGKYTKTVLLVGKGIVFDTGGNNLKPSEYIHNMEGDMAGAAAVMSTLKAVDELQLQGVRVIGLAPLTENRIGEAATLPNDVYTARNGKTVQISNTDAEGRLVLADAIHYGMERYKPDFVADIATLTGGKVRAVGEQNSIAISGNNDVLMKKVDDLSKDMGRRTAVLPLNNAHHKWVTRDGKGHADVVNSVSIADGQWAGVLTPLSNDRDKGLAHSAQGAAFLREFLPQGQEKTPWVHYDIAGAEFDKPNPRLGNDTWATGFGVKDLYALVKGISEGDVKAAASKSVVIKK